MPKLNPEWHITAPKIDPEYFLEIKNKILTKNILPTQIKEGMVRKSHAPFEKIKPKCAMCISANVKLSIIEAFCSPSDSAKLPCTIPLKNNSSPIGLNVILVTAKITK